MSSSDHKGGDTHPDQITDSILHTPEGVHRKGEAPIQETVLRRSTRVIKPATRYEDMYVLETDLRHIPVPRSYSDFVTLDPVEQKQWELAYQRMII